MSQKKRIFQSDPRKSQVSVVNRPNTKIKTRTLTDFEKRLYELCKAIPKGKVSTYGALAVILGSCARATGQGMRRNPFAPTVPCHRVIMSDLKIGGFSGSKAPDSADVCRKRSMLEAEGVKFVGDKVCPGFVIGLDELRVLWGSGEKLVLDNEEQRLDNDLKKQIQGYD